MTPGAAHVWLPGFFTGRRHAVLDVHHGMTFHGVRLAWSVCGRAAVVEPGQSGGGPCDRCVFLAGPPALERLSCPPVDRDLKDT